MYQIELADLDRIVDRGGGDSVPAVREVRDTADEDSVFSVCFQLIQSSANRIKGLTYSVVMLSFISL